MDIANKFKYIFMLKNKHIFKYLLYFFISFGLVACATKVEKVEEPQEQHTLARFLRLTSKYATSATLQKMLEDDFKGKELSTFSDYIVGLGGVCSDKDAQMNCVYEKELPPSETGWPWRMKIVTVTILKINVNYVVINSRKFIESIEAVNDGRLKSAVKI